MPADPLARYWSILGGDSEPRYLESKRVMVEADLNIDTGALWQAHDDAVKRASGGAGLSLLDVKIELANRMLKRCSLCERSCGVDRTAGEVGHCGAREARVSSEFIHMGEEPELIPSHTIFLSGCTFDCVFCQNWDISTRPDSGLRIEPKALAEIIDRRADPAGEGRDAFSRAGARNVNWVGGDPTSHLVYVLQTLKECNTPVPQVWNSNMYLTESSMKLLDGVVDVYLTDFKYGNDRCALRLSNVHGYMAVTERNHRIARSNAEMIIRHLVLPSHLECCTKPVLRWIADNLNAVKVNVMAQYRPAHKASHHPDISRPLRMSEYEQAISFAEELNLNLCD
jgi:putative pyruvate formate lyase activating enzyme